MSTMKTTRRDLFLAGATVAVGAGLPSELALAKATPAAVGPKVGISPWARGIDGQRKGDLGNGKFLNPVLAGDHPDPSVLRDGDRFYKVSSSFDYYPGLVVWQSTDLVNWTPMGPALRKPVGSVYAPDLVKHNGRYFIYFSAINRPGATTAPLPGPPRPPLEIYVVHADHITGPWSDPVSMGIGEGIDPGHALGEDGKRYLFLGGGQRVPISDDGLSRTGKAEKVYEGWQYPADWVVEGFEPEGPKMLRKDGWYYMISAEGGTAGPPTGHMVVVARSRSIHGPWENSPHNPLVRTWDVREPWWSKGHATFVEDRAGKWWMVYHGYENGFRTLGRQMLLEPLEWGADAWPRASRNDLSAPLRAPAARTSGPHGPSRSGPFTDGDFGSRLQFFGPGGDYAARAEVRTGALTLKGQGRTPADASPLAMNVGDRRYEVTVEMELEGRAQGGLILLYNPRFFCGLGADEKRFTAYKHGAAAFRSAGASPGRRFFLRVVNDENVASFYSSLDGASWTLVRSFEVAGYNHNVADGFLSLRPALFVAGSGQATFRSLNYRAL
jgi:beta-xylosidase